MTEKGRSVFATKKILKGEFICEYKGFLCSYSIMRDRQKKYETLGCGSFILEFKFKEKQWAIDATVEDNSFGQLINHSKKLKNVKPVVGKKKGMPMVYFMAIRNIVEDEQILYDYGDNSLVSRLNFPWLSQ